PVSADFLDIPYGSGNLELEINGHPDKGFTIVCQADMNDLIIERLPGAAAGKQRLAQNVSADLVATGYLAVKDNYVNLKSARLNLPGGTTVFSKGLIKYGDHLVLDLLNDVKVPKLEDLTARLPAVFGIIGAPAGDCSGKINIIGNLAANPVLRLNLSSQHLSFLQPGMGTVIGTGNSRSENSASGGNSCSPMKLLERLLAWSVDSDWLTEIRCTVDTLDLCPASFSEVELAGKKMMNQLVVEKLAGKTAGGDLRISLVVDDLLHEPLWNGSLVIKKVNLEKVLPGWPLSGEMDGSLVLGGVAPTVDDTSSAWLESVRGSGTLTVQKGVFKAHRLTGSLFGFSRLIGLQPADFLAPFSRLQIPVRISTKTCRMKKVKLSSPWYFFQGDGGLDFAGNLSLRGILSYADPAGPFTPGRPFPYRRRLKAKGSLDRLTWQ
ncbi:MAG: AsmA-like C-terminal region-containing protein, partial [Pseudomonadota bacterium]|nr:AsmA-like C-terminal region-containing protein [Pseudomonadota bacterium]